MSVLREAIAIKLILNVDRPFLLVKYVAQMINVDGEMNA